jgi:hypothetical protein
MRVVIASLQVSERASKGHLNPAIELALECQRRGHSVAILPQPSAFGEEDATNLRRLGIRFLAPPPLPAGVLRTAEELAAFAAEPGQTWKAFHSFLIAPLAHQFEGVLAILRDEAPDVTLYDLLGYAAPAAARRLEIPDVGYCAGLKLLAPDALQENYRVYRAALDDEIRAFFSSVEVSARFRHLELLSENGQFVFTSPGLVVGHRAPPGTRIVGALPVSPERMDVSSPAVASNFYAVLSFGSVFDPADFPKVTEAIFRATEARGLTLFVGSRRFSLPGVKLPPHVRAYPELPLPALLRRARAFFHHGGANSFSEALAAGAPQILIPLSTDQPIQGYYLRQSQAGFSFHPKGLTARALLPALDRLLDRDDETHSVIRRIAREFSIENGAVRAIDEVERVAAGCAVV